MFGESSLFFTKNLTNCFNFSNENYLLRGSVLFCLQAKISAWQKNFSCLLTQFSYHYQKHSFFKCFVRVHLVQPFSITDMATVKKNSSFILSERYSPEGKIFKIHILKSLWLSFNFYLSIATNEKIMIFGCLKNYVKILYYHKSNTFYEKMNYGGILKVSSQTSKNSETLQYFHCSKS